MRILWLTLVNALLLVRALLALPFAPLRTRARPEWVRFVLAGPVPYRWTPPTGLARFRRPPRPEAVRSLEALTAQVERLCSDGRVKGVVFELREAELSSAKRRVLGRLVEQLRAAGKQTVGYAVHAGNEECQLLARMDRIVLPPAGRLELVGYAANGLSFGGALALAGVTAHFIRRGPYKTAPELFTHRKLSDIQRETIERLLDTRYAELVTTLARGRRVTEEKARRWIDEGPYSARRALETGLCDGLAAKVDLGQLLDHPERKVAETSARPEPQKPRGEEAAKLGSFEQYQRSGAWPHVRWRALRRRPSVALVPLEGAIVPGEGGNSPLGPKVVGADAFNRALRRAVRDRRSKAIVLSITSPGGSALASELILDEIKRAGAKKPVVAYVERVAASGGYMAAVGAREIWADPQALLGSIGVFAGKFDASSLLERLGVGTELLTRGAHAGIFSPTRGLSESERGALEAEVEETYAAFLQIVADARGRTREEVHARGEGRVFSGAAAREQGLVDSLGGFEEACQRALGLAGVSAASFELRPFRPKPLQGPLLGLLQTLARTSLYALDLGLLLAEASPSRHEPVENA